MTLIDHRGVGSSGSASAAAEVEGAIGGGPANVCTKAWERTTAASLADLQSSPPGLTTTEAQLRLDRFGPNRAREKPPRPVWLKFIDQFKNLLVLVPIVAATLAAVAGAGRRPGVADRGRELGAGPGHL